MMNIINSFLLNAGLIILSLVLGYLLGFVLNCLWSPILRKIYKVNKILNISEFPIGFKKYVEYLSNLSIGVSMGIVYAIMAYKYQYSINFNIFFLFYIVFAFEFLAQKKWALTDPHYAELYSIDKRIFIKLKIINVLGYIITFLVVVKLLVILNLF